MEVSWEKCARLLALNTYSELLDLQEILNKILLNILSNPAEPKFREIKHSNKVLTNRVLSRKGGVEFLLAVGFSYKQREREMEMEAQSSKSLIYDMKKEIECMQREFQGGQDWLSETMMTCQEMITSTQRTAHDICAPCVIQLRFSTGQSVQGGFTGQDLLIDILSYARCYYIESRCEHVVLRLPDSPYCIEGERELLKTLEESGLMPKAVLLVSTKSVEEQREMMKQTSQHVKEEKKEVAKKHQKIKEEKQRAKEAMKRERERAILSFQEDRENQKERRERRVLLEDSNISQKRMETETETETETERAIKRLK